MRWRTPLLATAFALAGWQVLVWVTGVQHFILPGPIRVGQAMLKHWESLAEHGLVTLLEVVLGLTIGAALGIATAIHIAFSARARKYMLPVLVFSQAIPVFALAPVLTLWFGFGLSPKVIMAVLIVYFPVASAFYDGLNTTSRGYVDLAQVMGATPVQIMRRVRIPAAMPSLATGLRLAAVYAPIGAVIGEWVGSSKGLGYLMLLASGRAKIDLMFAAVVVLAFLTVAVRALVDWLCKRYLGEVNAPAL